MAHFYSVVSGGRGKPVTKTGTPHNGLTATVATWGAAIRTEVYHSEGMDFYRIDLVDWPSGKVIRTIEAGPIHSAIGKAAGHVGDIKPGTENG